VTGDSLRYHLDHQARRTDELTPATYDLARQVVAAKGGGLAEL
jgi:hypothetical protein